MNLTALLKLFITVCLFAGINNIYATDTLKNYHPVAVLVQLRSEHNKIDYLTKAGMYKEVEEVTKDALRISAAMINDFSDHFNFCPVYYYMDTNTELIQKRQFDGVLMNFDGTPAKNLVINNNSKDYFIIRYGNAVYQPRNENVVTDTSGSQTNSEEPFGKGFVIYNYKFKQISYLYKFGYDNVLFKIFNNRKYFYESKHYDMEYYPMAEKLNTKLIKREGKIRITHVNGIIDGIWGYE